MGKGVGSRCPSHFTANCKICNFAKKGTSFLESLAFMISTDDVVKDRHYGLRIMHNKMSVGSRITKSNCPFVSTSSNNIKKRLALKINNVVQ